MSLVDLLALSVTTSSLIAKDIHCHIPVLYPKNFRRQSLYNPLEPGVTPLGCLYHSLTNYDPWIHFLMPDAHISIDGQYHIPLYYGELAYKG